MFYSKILFDWSVGKRLCQFSDCKFGREKRFERSGNMRKTRCEFKIVRKLPTIHPKQHKRTDQRMGITEC